MYRCCQKGIRLLFVVHCIRHAQDVDRKMISLPIYIGALRSYVLFRKVYILP